MSFVKFFRGKFSTPSKAAIAQDELRENQPRDGFFDISNVVAVARKHPFYSPDNTYPLTPEEVAKIPLEKPHQSDVAAILSDFPITQKHDIYETTKRLATDKNPENTFRHSTYISVTGGGGGATASLAFLTDSRENRAQRAACGDLMRRLGLLTSKDCVLSMHPSGNLYRALDLMVDVVEYAGATALPAGHLLSFTELLEICRVFEPNVLTGDTTQIVNFASYIKSKRDCDNIKIDKILFTSEPMNLIQRSYIDSVFSRDGNPIQIISVLGSAEAGVWAVADFSLTGPPNDESTDFIFDSRHMIVECLPMDWDLSPENGNYPCARIEDKVGLIAITSLQRLRNPLVRYLTGDIGSIHQLSDVAFSKIQGNTQHLRVLRLYGRDIRQSFTWEGEYFEFFILKKFLQNASWGILKWQVVLDYDISVPDSESLEIRLIRTEMESNEGLITKEELVTQLKTLFWVHAKNEALFYVDFCKPEKFVRSATGNKVLMFIDQRKKTS